MVSDDLTPTPALSDDDEWQLMLTGLPTATRPRAFTLLCANRDGAAWDAAAREQVYALVSRRFPGFTVSEATGFFEHRPLPTLSILIATLDEAAVRALGRELRREFAQQAIGLLVGDRYERITD